MTYITIAGASYYMGTEVFHVGQELTIEKEPRNCYDDEAIKVVSDSGATYGYVANSTDTVARGTHSAGYIYRDFERCARIRVCFILCGRVIAEILE